jgi:hypothetical protein
MNWGREPVRVWCVRRGPDGRECRRSQLVDLPTRSNRYTATRGHVLRCHCGGLGTIWRDQRGEIKIDGYLQPVKPGVGT